MVTATTDRNVAVTHATDRSSCHVPICTTDMTAIILPHLLHRKEIVTAEREKEREPANAELLRWKLRRNKQGNNFIER